MRFKGNGKRKLESRYIKAERFLNKNYNNAVANGWTNLWRYDAPPSRKSLNDLPGIDTDPGYYDYAAVCANSVGPCIVWASKSGKISDEFKDLIRNNFGNFRIHDSDIQTYQIMDWRWNHQARVVRMKSYYITIDSFYDDVEIRDGVIKGKEVK